MWKWFLRIKCCLTFVLRVFSICLYVFYFLFQSELLTRWLCSYSLGLKIHPPPWCGPSFLWGNPVNYFVFSRTHEIFFLNDKNNFKALLWGNVSEARVSTCLWTWVHANTSLSISWWVWVQYTAHQEDPSDDDFFFFLQPSDLLQTRKPGTAPVVAAGRGSQ